MATGTQEAASGTFRRDIAELGMLEQPRRLGG
jgi:hypothetical protein